jgi:hypothetical protein
MATHTTNKQKKLVTELYKTVEVFGEDNTANILYSARKQNVSSQKVKAVIDAVCQKLNIPAARVIDTSDKNQKRVMALKFICYYCCDAFNDLSTNDIAIAVKKGISLVQKYHKEMVKKRVDKEDAYHQQKFKELDIAMKVIHKQTK